MSPRDAGIEFAITDDGMTAVVAVITEPEKGGASLSAQAVGKALKKAGITVPPILSVVERIVSGDPDVVGAIIAKGTPPTAGTDATIRPLGDMRYPVFPNETFCEIIQAKPASDGCTVTGTPLKASVDQQGKSISFPEQPNCFIDTKTLQVRSEVYGIPVFEKHSLFVRPAIHVDSQQMQVIATIHPTDFKGRPLAASRMKETLTALDIAVPLDTAAFDKAVAAAAANGRAEENVVIAKGLSPLHGKNGWFELFVQDDRSDVGLEDDSGNIDFRARGVVRSVPAGAAVGKLHAPTRGIPGKDVFGKIIPAHDGAVFRINLGENVEATESGSEFTATIGGMVFCIGNTLSVTEVFTTGGDVNMGTGNIELEKGSVHVRGAILSGFSVQCPRNVLVDDTVESAVIKAGGDVEVKAGIIMDRGGRIVAKGGVSAMFAKGATIEVEGDVNIAHELSNCIVFAGQNVIATKGRGKIVGSTIRCGGSIIANEVGSDLGVATTLFLGLEQETNDHGERKKQLRDLLQKIYASLGTGDPRTLLQNTPPAKRDTVAQVLKMRLGAEKELQEIEARIAQEKAAHRKSFNSKLKVTRTIHPGTVVHSCGLVFKVTTPIEHSSIFFSAEEGKIIVASL